ncbi:50S ribosomal protein P1 [Candidatus Woesearchaeota archaeon]|nr:50S ribosomal protein P1 [Candidatus Woesearchaeota archaeon]
MIYLYGALLLHKAGKEINEGNLKKVVESAGVKADDGRIKALVSALQGVNIEEVIKQASVAPVAVQAVPAAQGAAAPKAKEGPSEEEKKKEEEKASAGLASLFG